MGFSRQEYWSGLPFPSPGDLPEPEIEPWSPELQVDSLPTELPGTPFYLFWLLWVFIIFCGLSLVAVSGSYSLAVVQSFLIAVASLFVERRLDTRDSEKLPHSGLVVTLPVLEHRLSSCAHELSCSATYGIFPGQGSNPCPLHWQAESYLLCHREVPFVVF